MANNRFQTLSFTQVEKLDAVIGERRFIHSRNKAILPTTLEFALRHFIVLLRDHICKYGIHIEEIRLNGGAASYILGEDTVPTFNDLDIIFKLSIAGEAEFEIIRIAVLECLREYLPTDTDPSRVNENNLAGAYVDKMIKIWNERDRWSLISLGFRPNNVELKFVCQMVREYQFSVDSFQIMLDPLLTFYSISSRSISEHFFPTIVAESVYGSFSEAFSHLKNKLIATCSPENIRGGGLLRYCDLLVKGYQSVDEQNFFKKEQYMCTRFFIDFMDVPEQARQISGYLQNHFAPTDPRKYDYLKYLEAVIERSAVCLMNQERQYALDVIARLAQYELRWREAFIPAYLPMPSHFGYYYHQPPPPPQQQQQQQQPCHRVQENNNNNTGTIPMLSNNGRVPDQSNSNKKSHYHHHHHQHNYPPRAFNRHQQQQQQNQPIQRPNNIFYCPSPQAAFLQCRCQQCLGQYSPVEMGENSAVPGAVCCVPVWISPTRLYPPSSLVVIAGTPIAMSSPSSSGSSSLGSNGFGTRATPSPTTFPTNLVNSSSSCSSTITTTTSTRNSTAATTSNNNNNNNNIIPNASIHNNHQYEYDDAVLNGDIINACVLGGDDDGCSGVDDEQLFDDNMSSRSSELENADPVKMQILLNNNNDDSGVETLSTATS